MESHNLIPLYLACFQVFRVLADARRVEHDQGLQAEPAGDAELEGAQQRPLLRHQAHLLPQVRPQAQGRRLRRLHRRGDRGHGQEGPGRPQVEILKLEIVSRKYLKPKK